MLSRNILGRGVEINRLFEWYSYMKDLGRKVLISAVG
jgi:hypothetical protein